jgi:nucleoside-diphosphate-sugar epimerase
MAMKALVIGATGYVGAHVAQVFRQRGYAVSGLARSSANADALKLRGLAAAPGSFENLEALKTLVGKFDLVVMAAMVPFDVEFDVMAAVVEGCRQGETRQLLFTSGTGVLSIESRDGRWSQYTFAEDDPFPFPARPNRAARIRTEDHVRQAAGEGLRTFVIRPPLIYGNGGSIQIPQIFESVRRTGHACYLGHGLNLYSAVHVEDLAEVYALAVERGAPGALYHAVCGEANFRSIAEAVGQVCGVSAKGLDYDAACALWGGFWVDIALAVNSRSIARRTVEELGWQPRHLDVIEDIRSGSYADAFRAGLKAYSWTSHG